MQNVTGNDSVSGIKKTKTSWRFEIEQRSNKTVTGNKVREQEIVHTGS